MKRHFIDTTIPQMLDYEKQVKTLAEFLIKNRYEIVLNDNRLNEVLYYRNTVLTPIAAIFEQMVNSNYQDNFCTLFIDKTSSVTGIPDIITNNSLVVDFKGLPINNTLTSVREVYDKVIANITPVTKFINGRPQFGDITELQSIYIKGLLVRSFNKEGLWLTSNICEYIIETYSFAIANKLFSLYNLDTKSRLIVQIYLATFMAGKLDDSREPIPRVLGRCSFLGNSREVEDIILNIPEILGRDVLPLDMNLDDLSLLISKAGPERLNSFTSNEFNRICTTLGFTTDIITTQIALEYPPYWVFLLLNALSNSRVGGLISQLKTNKLMIKGKTFVSDLRSCRTLYEE